MNKAVKILIVDDEEPAGNILRLLIDKHIPGEKQLCYCSSPEEALKVLPTFRPTLIMLDIEMPNMNGFDFLNYAVNSNFDVIFTTAYDKYAIKAIRFSALDYLLKPIDVLELQNAINRHIIKQNTSGNGNQQELVENLIENLKQKNPDEFKLAVSVKEGVFLFEPKEIICLEGLNNYTRFSFIEQKPLVVAKTLKEYDEILSSYHFVRVHKSYLVNKDHIKRMDNEGLLWLTNNISVPISRRKKEEVTRLLKSKVE
jgi:two-component system, LytTR family, response regulator